MAEMVSGEAICESIPPSAVIASAGRLHGTNSSHAGSSSARWGTGPTTLSLPLGRRPRSR